MSDWGTIRPQIVAVIEGVSLTDVKHGRRSLRHIRKGEIETANLDRQFTIRVSDMEKPGRHNNQDRDVEISFDVVIIYLSTESETHDDERIVSDWEALEPVLAGLSDTVSEIAAVVPQGDRLVTCKAADMKDGRLVTCSVTVLY